MEEREVSDKLIRMIDQFSSLPVEQIPELSQETIEALYTCGYAFYKNGLYEDSLHFFRFLTLIDSNTPKNWMGLGAAYKMMKNYDRAVQAYGYAALLDENLADAHFHASECFRFLGDEENANKAMKAAEHCFAKK